MKQILQASSKQRNKTKEQNQQNQKYIRQHTRQSRQQSNLMEIISALEIKLLYFLNKPKKIVQVTTAWN
jgi:hypothetical protein